MKKYRLNKRDIDLLKLEMKELKEDIYSSDIKQRVPFINGKFEVFNPAEHLLTHINIANSRIRDLLPEITEEHIIEELNKLENKHYWRYSSGEFLLVNGNYKHDNGDDMIENRISAINLDLRKIPLSLSYEIMMFFMFNCDENEEEEGE